ncbi:hypothetical protein, partial [Klebsiella pneumoniae]|uniref:hypothetical protein n=1 Tax=Klebsiella pneumoniae TaxID=573 RepID=UPI001C6F999B
AAVGEIFLYLLRVTHANPAHRIPPGSVSYMKLCFLFNTVNIKAMNLSSSANVIKLLMNRLLIS